MSPRGMWRAHRKATGLLLTGVAAVTAAVLALTLSETASNLPTANAAPTSPAGVPHVLRADGSVDPVAYRTLANSLATSRGVRYRFGPPAAASSAASLARPTAYAARTQALPRYLNRPDSTFQVGGPHNPAKNDFSSNQGQVGYVPAASALTMGVDHVETLNMTENTFSEQPRLSWTYYGQGHPEPDFTEDSAPGACMNQLGATSGRFVAQARAYAHGEATANSLVVFDNGVIASAGTNTARGRACLRLPRNLQPSAISLTNGNEFALVTAWNTDTLESELAVIALGGREPVNTFWGYEWSELYPGFRNYGVPTFLKLLGTIPLPVAAATGVSAVSDYSMSDQLTDARGATVNPGSLPLSDEVNRQSFIRGGNKAKRATAGYAVVFSREEHKTVFVDLQPLFSHISNAYFGSRTRFRGITANIGQRATQWPYAFSAAPAERPVVIKTVTTAKAPTAVAAMLSGARTPRAYVATVDGRLHVFTVGGLASAGRSSARQIVQHHSIPIGRNATSITYVKDRVTGNAVDQSLDSTLIITSRGDRKIQWVSLKGSGGGVVRELRDSRLVDPIAAEDNNTHGTESYLLSVADYGAGRLFNFRYGPVIFHTNGGAVFGMGRSGKDEFEFGGAYNPEGRPFSISVTNVT